MPIRSGSKGDIAGKKIGNHRFATYTADMMIRAPKHVAGRIIYWFEIFLAAVIIVAIIISLFHSFGVVQSMDWSSIDTFYELINRLLLIAIGLEFVRMLVVRDLVSVLELVAFIVARKMLKPDATSMDLMLGSIAFVTLTAARYGIAFYHKKTGDKRLPILTQEER